MTKPGKLRALLPLIGCLYGLALAGSVLVLVDILVTGVEPGPALDRSIADFMAGQLDVVLLVAAGGAVGMLLGIAAMGSRWVRQLLVMGAGAVLGSLAGLVTFVLGYVMGNQDGVPDRATFVALAREAVSSLQLVEILLVVLGGALGLAVARYAWRFQGVLTYTALVSVVVGYISYSLLVTLPSVPASALPLSVILFLAEALTLGMIVAYAFYSIDVSERLRWDREGHRRPFSKHFVPKVAFHVAIYNEPPDMVIETLERVRAVDYPADRYVVMVLDDSTDEALRAPVERYCRRHGLIYLHREDRTGFKAGALNAGLAITPEDVDLIAVLDADYQIEPEYLRETVGFFIEPNLGFLQTPQDYRNADQSFLTRRYSRADAFFYRAVLPSRNEENAIIFCGTMGIVRRTALEEAGGWGEDFITEDAELSLRILRRGYDSLYVDKTYGRGLIPATFDGYKKQHYRWAFGGVQILRAHFWTLLSPYLSRRQRFDYLTGAAHWFDGLYLLTIAMVIAIIGAGDALGYPVLTHHVWEVWLIGLVPLFLLLDGITRIHLAMNARARVPLRETLGVLGMWYSIKFNDMSAALKAMVRSKMPFVRTPKAPKDRVGRGEALSRALQMTPLETTMGTLMIGIAAGVGYRLWSLAETTSEIAVTRVLLMLWLSYHALIFLTAPLYAYRSYVTFEPDAEEGSPSPTTTAEVTGW